MNNHNLEAATEEKDLRVTFDKELKFRSHIRNIVSKANSRVGIIKRTFEYLTIENFKILYKSQVRPVLEYCTDIWYPTYAKDMVEVEKVQKRATKLVKGLEHKPYSERLRELDIPSMEYRRNRTDLIQTFRILKGYDNLDPSLFFEMDCRGVTRGHSMKLIKPRVFTRNRQYSFSQRVINPWNSLPEQVVSADSINSFKDRLELIWRNNPVKYSPSFLHT